MKSLKIIHLTIENGRNIMKKLSEFINKWDPNGYIFLVIIVILLLTIKCGHVSFRSDKDYIIYSIDRYNSMCEYNLKVAYGPYSSNNVTFIDSCGKYTIGDTVQFIKRVNEE